MQKFAAMVLGLALLVLGTGALQYIHERDHDAEDARMDAVLAKAGMPPLSHQHDESNCDLCAQLHLVLILHGWVPLLILLELLVAFLTELARPLISRPPPARLSCRGPPVVALV